MLACFLFVLCGVGAHAFDRLSQVSHVQSVAARQGLRPVAADVFEPVLDGGDVAAELGRVGRGDDRLDASARGFVHVSLASPGPVGGVVFQYASPRGARLVVYGLAPAVAGLLPSDGLAGRGEQVQQRVGECPQPVDQVALLLGVIAPVGRVFPDDVVVARLDRGLVVLPVRAAAGLFDVPLLQPVDQFVVDELGAVV